LSQLCQSLGGVKLKWVLLYSGLKGWVSWLLLLLSFFLERGTLLSQEFFLGAEQCHPGVWNDAAK